MYGSLRPKFIVSLATALNLLDAVEVSYEITQSRDDVLDVVPWGTETVTDALSISPEPQQLYFL